MLLSPTHWPCKHICAPKQILRCSNTALPTRSGFYLDFTLLTRLDDDSVLRCWPWKRLDGLLEILLWPPLEGKDLVKRWKSESVLTVDVRSDIWSWGSFLHLLCDIRSVQNNKCWIVKGCKKNGQVSVLILPRGKTLQRACSLGNTSPEMKCNRMIQHFVTADCSLRFDPIKNFKGPSCSCQSPSSS